MLRRGAAIPADARDRSCGEAACVADHAIHRAIRARIVVADRDDVTGNIADAVAGRADAAAAHVIAMPAVQRIAVEIRRARDGDDGQWIGRDARCR